jgi:putative Mg2+ transporter-C (MgtC) family protein
MAAGAGLPVLAVATTIGYFAVVYGFTPLSAYLRRTQPRARYLEVIYEDGRGLLRQILSTCTARGWVIARLSTRHLEASVGLGEANLSRGGRDSDGGLADPNPVSVVIGMDGIGSYEDLVAALSELDGVLAVSATTPNDEIDPEVE